MSRYFVGVISSYNGAFGYIECSEAHAMYQREILLERNVFEESNCEVGSTVKFQVGVRSKIFRFESSLRTSVMVGGCRNRDARRFLTRS